MSIENPNDAEQGPSREELRQIVRSRPTGEFASPKIAEQVATKIKDDGRVAEVRKSLGLEPELSDRRGEGNEQRVKEGDTTMSNGLGVAVRAPRTEHAFRERERIDSRKILGKKIDFAKSLGVNIPNFEVPDEDGPTFDEKAITVGDKLWGAMVRHYDEFGKNLSKNDPEMKALLSEYAMAQRQEREATSGSYRELNDAKYGSLKQKPLKRLFNAVRLVLGGDSIVEKGQQAIATREKLGDQVVALTCKKFEDAGLNKWGPEQYGINLTVTPATSNLRRAEEVMGVNLQS